MGEETTSCKPGPCSGGTAFGLKRKRQDRPGRQQVNNTLGVSRPIMCDIMRLCTNSSRSCASTHTCRMALLTPPLCVLMDFPPISKHDRDVSLSKLTKILHRRPGTHGFRILRKNRFMKRSHGSSPERAMMLATLRRY